MKKSNKTPLVSICCIAYNHEKFISKCIEGFLMQKTKFVFEILIHDDASTDNTQAIIKKYAKNNKELIITVLQEKNQWSKRKRIIREFLYPKVKGKYIALCEGDDFWIDPYKLQKQVNFLESHPKYGLVRTDHDVLFDKTQKSFRYRNVYHDNKITSGDIYNDLLIENTIGTLTVLYRKKILDDNFSSPFISGEMKYKMGDYPMWLLISLHSKIGYISDSTATYRVLESSASHFTDVKKKYEFLMSEFQVKFDFIKAFGCKKEVEEKIFKSYYKVKIKYGFLLEDFKMIKKYYKKLLLISKPSLKERMLYLSTESNFNWYITNIIIKYKNSLSI